MLTIDLAAALQDYKSRHDHSMTLERLSCETGLSVATLQSMSSRADYNPTLKTLGLVCDVLGCEPSVLIKKTTGK